MAKFSCWNKQGGSLSFLKGPSFQRAILFGRSSLKALAQMYTS